MYKNGSMRMCMYQVIVLVLSRRIFLHVQQDTMILIRIFFSNTGLGKKQNVINIS